MGNYMRLYIPLLALLFIAACSNDQQAASTFGKTETKKIHKSPEKNITAYNEQKASSSGHSIYAHKCASCHGRQGEKAALNTSKVIQGWDEADVVTALEGYKDGTYGLKLKGIMKGQVTALTPQEIKAVAAYVSTL